jgi:hypothetical protein
VVLDVERAQPALLAHGDGDEIADLDDLRFGEVRVQPRPQNVVGRLVPGDTFGIGKRGFLLVASAWRGLEIDQVPVVLLDQAGPVMTREAEMPPYPASVAIAPA